VGFSYPGILVPGALNTENHRPNVMHLYGKFILLEEVEIGDSFLLQWNDYSCILEWSIKLT
jgi:hypothetical protein